jgi:hypothetical protein
VNVTAGTGCTWTATSNDAWITINSGTPGSGNGTVNYTVSANTGPARSGTLTVAGQTHTVEQDALISNLRFDEQPPPLVAGLSGDSLIFTVVTSGGIGPVAYQWYKEDGSKALVPLGGDSDTLDLSPLDLADTGRYYCQASDDLTSIWTDGTELVVSQGLPLQGAALLLAAAIGALALLQLRRAGRR